MTHPAELTVIALLIALLGCSGAFPPPKETTAPADAPAPAPLRDPPSTPVGPEATFGAVPGWMAFVARRPGAPIDRPWTPNHPTAAAVVMSGDAWSAIPTDSAVRLVAIEGNESARFGGVAIHPFGCDGVPTTMAAFDLEMPLAEQIVWLLPPEAEGATAVPIVQTQADVGKSTWQIGPLEAIVRATTPTAGTLTFFHGDEAVHERAWEQPPVEGLTLSVSDPSPGVPLPGAAFQLDPDTLVIVTVAPSLEGINFDVLLWRQRMVVEGSTYVYRCAY